MIGTAHGLLTNTIRVGPAATDIDLGTACLLLSSTSSAINIKLTWGQRPNDLDSYLVTPDGFRINYASKGSLLNSPYANLDVDDTDSYGPEVVTVTKLQVGTYRYYVNNYSETFDPGMTASPARVELSVNGNTSLYTPPTGEGDNQWWHVFNLTVDASCGVSITQVGAWQAASPTTTTSAATYCTPAP